MTEKCLSAVMLFLIRDVLLDALACDWADRKRSVTLLPCEITDTNLVMYPN